MNNETASRPDETGEKRQFLVHIEADVIRRIKILAIERGVTASSLVQQAVVDFLARQSQSAVPKSGNSEKIL